MFTGGNGGENDTLLRAVSGIYIYRFSADGPAADSGLKFRKVRRMQVIK